MLTELSVSLFSILLLPSLHNKVYTLFLYFSVLQTGFCNLLIFSTKNKLNFFDSSAGFIPRRSHPRVINFQPSHRFQFGCACVAFPFYYSYSLQLFGLFFIHSNTVKSCFQAYILSSPKIFRDKCSFIRVTEARQSERWAQPSITSATGLEILILFRTRNEWERAKVPACRYAHIRLLINFFMYVFPRMFCVRLRSWKCKVRFKRLTVCVECNANKIYSV